MLSTRAVFLTPRVGVPYRNRFGFYGSIWYFQGTFRDGPLRSREHNSVCCVRYLQGFLALPVFLTSVVRVQVGPPFHDQPKPGGAEMPPPGSCS